MNTTGEIGRMAFEELSADAADECALKTIRHKTGDDSWHTVVVGDDLPESPW